MISNRMRGVFKFGKFGETGKSWENRLFFVFAGLMAFLFLSVLLKTGYMGDDAYNSQIIGNLIQSHMSLTDRMIDTLGWMKGPGRLFPLSWYHYPVHYYITSRIIFKWLGIAVVITSVVIFAHFMKLLTRSSNIGILTLLIVPAFFQFRNTSADPILAFGFLMPLLAVYVFLVFVFFQRFLESQKGVYFWLSFFFHLVALLTYEVSYPTFILIFMLAWQKSRDFKTAWRVSRSHVFLGLSIIVISILMKTPLNPYFDHGYPASTPHLNISLIFRTFWIQAYAAFPLSYYFKTRAQVLGSLSWLDRAAVVGFFACSFYLVRGMRDKANHYFMMAFGFVLWTAPSMLIAFSGHQEEIIRNGFGEAYLPVYLEYFGLFTLILGLFLETYSRVRSSRIKLTLNLLFSFVFALTAFYNFGENRTIALSMNSAYLYPRQILQAALDDGLLKNVSEDSLILRAMRLPHDWVWFYITRTRKIYRVEEPSDFFKKLAVTETRSPRAESALVHGNGAGKNMYVLAYNYDSQAGKTGAVYLAPLDEYSIDSSTGDSGYLKVRKMQVYEYPSGKIQELEFGDSGIDFFPLIHASEKLPFQAKDFNAAEYRIRP